VSEEKKHTEDTREKAGKSFEHLVDIMRRLLSREGCPWDRQQSHASLKPYLIEEAYEVIESIDAENFTELKEELGDVMLQIVFHAELAREEGHFDIADVLETICNKMIHRHPHVFGAEKWDSAEEVLRNWEEIKKAEKQEKRNEEHVSILEGVPRNLPALIRAHRVQDRAARVGFDWDNIKDVYKKVLEEIDELKLLLDDKKAQDQKKIQGEFGDLLFALVNLARFLEVHPEEALQSCTEKFIRRFHYIEQQAHQQGRTLKSMTLAEMDALWEESKKLEPK